LSWGCFYSKGLKMGQLLFDGDVQMFDCLCR